jgi:thioredoxin reductase (NADPH)
MTGNNIYDMVIIGGGPAGLTAGLYAARSRMNALLLEQTGFGGQLLVYERVENYPGFPEGIGAFALSDLMRDQALRFGLVTRNVEVTGIEVADPIKKVHTSSGTIETKTVVLACGASPNKLGVKGESAFTGRGVSYCAVCDAPFYRNQEVAVVGGGDTAVEEALYLTKFASRVHVIHRRDRLRATSIIRDRAFGNEKISFVLNSVVTEIKGGGTGVEAVEVRNLKDDRPSLLPVTGIFVFVGIRPNSAFIPAGIARCNAGFILTDQEMATSVPGVYAAGDVRSKALRQIVTAVADGATAAFSASRYVEDHYPAG